jgi:hypothetical protein
MKACRLWYLMKMAGATIKIYDLRGRIITTSTKGHCRQVPRSLNGMGEHLMGNHHREAPIVLRFRRWTKRQPARLRFVEVVRDET